MDTARLADITREYEALAVFRHTMQLGKGAVETGPKLTKHSGHLETCPDVFCKRYVADVAWLDTLWSNR